MRAMICPSCGKADATLVTNTRHRIDGSVRRRHQCDRCRIRWTSQERLVLGTINPSPAPLIAARSARKAGADC